MNKTVGLGVIYTTQTTNLTCNVVSARGGAFPIGPNTHKYREGKKIHT